MKVVFVSNYLNHHQLPIAKAFSGMEDVEYSFIATIPIPEERLGFGYVDMNKEYEFVIRTYENKHEKKKAKILCNEADVVILGSAPRKFINKRLKENKLTFCYSERLYKKKKPAYLMPLVSLKRFWQCGRHKNMYLLCASAYTAGDYAKTGTFLNKAYKWGYFPEVKNYENIDTLIQNKKKNTLLWVARLIELKHPELCIEVAKRLKSDGIKFELNIIGNGPMEDELSELIHNNCLENEVKLLGSMSPDKVRENMENSKIFFFTSDRQEGWGAVLNESMNSGCAVVASDIIGSVPFLLKNNENGFIYHNGNTDDLYNKIKFLLENPEKQVEFGKKAYETMVKEWNAENAAEKFIKLAKELLGENESPNLFEDGVCSTAEIMEG